MKKLLIIFIAFVATFSLQSQTWTNPMTLSGEWVAYGIGDPYIMKYRGTYYLYCSTKNNNVGVKCWSSKDLTTWSGPYTCSTDPITKTAYAPEVVYWNGIFYMYTSPAGNGHYVLTSTSPTGPFSVVTGNLGKSIDGSVFINDDGNWYFYHANGSGIMGCAMSSPTTIGDDVNLNAWMGGSWTEGPCVIKRNGIYYLVYTGNHVISKGYRTDYAKNTIGPISTYAPQTAQNPILVKSEGAVVGLGHGSAFIGPDLDSYYFCYHNLASNVGPFRHLNIDRMAWNGDKLLMLGPSVLWQQAPQLPDQYDYFNRTDLGANWTTPNGGNWYILNQDSLMQTQIAAGADTTFKAIYNTATSSNYTAEFNLMEIQRDANTAAVGAVFGYTDENNYGVALLHSYTNKLEVNFKTNGIWTAAKTYSLPTDYKYSCWHNIRIEKAGTAYKIFVDNMLKCTTTSTLDAGKIGYITSNSRGSFGFIAFSNKVNGSGIFDTYKPIPGKIQAVHYNTGGEGVGYHDLSAGNSGGKYTRTDSVDISDCTDGGFAISDNQSGEWYKYNINIKLVGTYNVGLRYAAAAVGGQVRIWQGDTDLTGIVEIPSTDG
ncbi:MAG: family 43 glycosylhydrolase, partial [Paludibacter sp.]|nr:family 43 glycosylhydrolase [Paludibacter sp.]